MDRRRAFGIIVAAMGAPLPSPALPSAKSCPEPVRWVTKVLEKMGTIKVGDTRKNLSRVFTKEGGLSTALERTYVSRDCPLFKVDVTFHAIGRPEIEPDGRSTSVESDDDTIAVLSPPYLAFQIFD